MTRTVTLELSPALDAVLVEKATGSDTPETLAARIVEEWCAPHAVAKEAAVRSELARNEALVELGKRVAAAPPKKQAAVFAAVEEALA